MYFSNQTLKSNIMKMKFTLLLSPLIFASSVMAQEAIRPGQVKIVSPEHPRAKDLSDFVCMLQMLKKYILSGM